MKSPLVIAFDIGTQSLRGLIVDSGGNILYSVKRTYERPYFSPYPGWAEQEPDFYFNNLCAVGLELRSQAGSDLNKVIAVTVTAMRDTLLWLDAEMRPLRNIIVWLDQRKAELKPFPLKTRAALALVNMTATVEAQYKAAHCNWVIQNQPEIWERTAKVVLLSTYINYKLTGRLADSPAALLGHLPMDYKKRRWQKPGVMTRCMCDVPLEKLCEVVESGTTIGQLTASVAAQCGLPEGLPLITTGSDKSCETLGLSVFHDHQAAISYGTAATIQVTSDHYFEPQPFLPAYPAIPPGMCNPEVQIYRGYWLVSWFKEQFAQEECARGRELGCPAETLLDGRLSMTPAGCDGLLLQPYWGPGMECPDARGAIIGFTDVHTRDHLYRAILEGVGFALYHAMRTMEKRGKRTVKELFIAGGGSQSAAVCQLTANLFGLPVQRIQTHEASGLGAAAVAFVACGVYDSYEQALSGMVHVRDVFLPDLTEHAVYDRIYQEEYRHLYKRLAPLYKRMH